MRLPTQKSRESKFQILMPALAIITIVANYVSPTITYAKAADLSSTAAVFAETPEGRMFNPPVIVQKPDRMVKAVITVYTSTPDQTDDSPFIAASGKRVHDGMIAANWLPFGAQIKIPSLYGDKIFTVEDRMNKRYGFGRLDIWLDTTKQEARKFGVKRVAVEVFYVKEAPKQIVKK